MKRLGNLPGVVLVCSLLPTIVPAGETVRADELQPPAPRKAPYFSPEILLGHIYYLASDELGGRASGTPGNKRAARYIADQFAAAGIEPAGEDGTYFQAVEVNLGGRFRGGGEFHVEGADVEAPVMKEDYVPFPWSSGGDVDAEVVFAGYGLVNPDEDYDDYAGLDVEGKVVLMLRREPPSWSDGIGYTDLARFDNKVAEAKERGAVAVLIANRKPPNGDEDRLTPFIARGGREGFGLPAFHVTRALANKLLAAANLDALDVMQEKLDADTPAHCSAVAPDVRVKAKVEVERGAVVTDNVVGMVRGTGPQRDEYVVIGAHYDHVGRQRVHSFFGSGGGGKEEIHNGADDNASGTAGVIELGRVLARAGDLNRSVILIAFAAEELGLHGSRRYATSPTVPQDRIAAMVNMDMIGRLARDDTGLTVYGVGTGVGLEDLVLGCAKNVGMEVDTIPAVSGHSDEDSFYDQGVPVVFLFSGMHADLHKPTDDAEKINEQGAARAVQLAYGIARGLIDSETAPAYCYVADREEAAEEPHRAVMGFWPGESDEDADAGILVGRTAPNGPADRAGIRAGDRIVRIGGRDVGSVGDYAKVTGQNRPGDTVEVIVVREGQEIALKLAFAAG